MGKSELDHIIEEGTRFSHNLNPIITNNSDPNLCLAKENVIVEKTELPEEMTIFDRQVAGHFHDGKNPGMVKFKDVILKPIQKTQLGEREANFYECVQSEQKQHKEQKRKNFLFAHNGEGPLWKLVPQYFGRRTIKMNEQSIDCLVLEDLTRGFKEPCIMDVKIGRRTWDPFAGYEKIIREDSKYQGTKRDLGICVPGFQVYDVKTGKLRKYGKEFGQQLDKYSIIDAFKTFLNADKHMSRHLLLQLLVQLWSIQHWSRNQTTYNLYSSSILLTYDARRLRLNLQSSKKLLPTLPLPKCPPKPPKRTNSLYRPMSMATINDKAVCTGFSGQFDEHGPIFPHKVCKSIALSAAGENYCKKEQSTLKKNNSSTSLKRVHSFHHNYDEDLQCIRSDYNEMLEDLVVGDDCRSELWATAKMIDFAHTYRKGNDGRVDENYSDGIESLVQILESFLADAQDD